MDEIAVWLDRIFPSSRVAARLIHLDEPCSLSSGETFSIIAMVQLVDYQSDEVVRAISLIFSKGESRRDLCDASFSIFLNASGDITHVEQGRHSQVDSIDWHEHFEHSYSDSQITEPWKFESALEALRTSLLPAMNQMGFEIKQDHPLLNRHQVSSVVIRRKKDGDDFLERS